LKILKKSLILGNIEKSGMGYSKTISFSLSAFHTSPDTACQMANFAFTLLDSAVKSISVDRARRNRVFIEGQLEKNKMILDTLQKNMQNYQIQNKAYDIPEQVRMSISTYANLKAAMITNEIQMQTVKNEFAEETPELKGLQKNHQAYQTSLSQLESRTTPDAMPSLSVATKLLPHYLNLLRDIEVQNQVILLITREVEQAKIKEAKNVSALVVIDPAFKPEYKSRPKRIFILAGIVGMYMAFVMLMYFYGVFYRLNVKNRPIIQTIKAVWREKH
jgi:capsule polysaccharide export protein KpsE/RkpR